MSNHYIAAQSRLANVPLIGRHYGNRPVKGTLLYQSEDVSTRIPETPKARKQLADELLRTGQHEGLLYVQPEHGRLHPSRWPLVRRLFQGIYSLKLRAQLSRISRHSVTANDIDALRQSREEARDKAMEVLDGWWPKWLIAAPPNFKTPKDVYRYTWPDEAREFLKNLAHSFGTPQDQAVQFAKDLTASNESTRRKAFKTIGTPRTLALMTLWNHSRQIKADFPAAPFEATAAVPNSESEAKALPQSQERARERAEEVLDECQHGWLSDAPTNFETIEDVYRYAWPDEAREVLQDLAHIIGVPPEQAAQFAKDLTDPIEARRQKALEHIGRPLALELMTLWNHSRQVPDFSLWNNPQTDFSEAASEGDFPAADFEATIVSNAGSDSKASAKTQDHNEIPASLSRQTIELLNESIKSPHNNPLKFVQGTKTKRISASYIDEKGKLVGKPADGSCFLVNLSRPGTQTRNSERETFLLWYAFSRAYKDEHISVMDMDYLREREIPNDETAFMIYFGRPTELDGTPRYITSRAFSTGYPAIKKRIPKFIEQTAEQGHGVVCTKARLSPDGQVTFDPMNTYIAANEKNSKAFSVISPVKNLGIATAGG